MISPSQPPFHPRRDVRPRDAECLKQGRGGARAWLLKSKALTYECTDCGRQASVTAGTIMHASKLPLTIWFWAAFLMATHSNGSSADSVETAVLQPVYLVRDRVPLLRYGAHAGLIS